MRVVAGLLSFAVASTAQASDRPMMFDLPAGPLGRSAALLSGQARIDVGVDDPALQQMMVPPVRGRMRVEQVFDRLLRGSPAMWQRGRDGVWRVLRRPAPRKRLYRPAPVRRPLVAPEPGEIVVTASKRETRLADYAGSVEVIGGEALGYAGTPGGSDAVVARAASLGSTYFGSGRDKLFIRGIVDSSFGGPGQATTGQYLDNARINFNGPDPDLLLYDVDRIEILSGPQGTLHGAGTLGGVIRVLTRRPQPGAAEGRVMVGGSITAHGAAGSDASAVFNLPLVRDRAALRIVAYGARTGGYVDNALLRLKDVNAARTYGGRGALRVHAADWTIDLGAALQSNRADDSDWTDAAAPKLVRRSAVREPYGGVYRQATLGAERPVGTLRFVSTLAVVRHRTDQRYDTGADDPPQLVIQRDRYDMSAFETRLSHETIGGAGWVAGLSLVDSKSRMGRFDDVQVDGALPRQRAINRLREATLFGEASLPLNARLVATGGLRLGYVEQRGEAWARLDLAGLPPGGKPQVVGFSKRRLRALPGFSLSYRLGGDRLVFARYQEGFRPGGAGIAGPEARLHGGDHIQTAEVGGRFVWPEAGLRLALSASYARWDGILAEVVSRTGDLMTANIGDGEIASIEGQLGWRPADAWDVHAGVFVNRSRLTKARLGTIVLRGARLPNVADIGLQAGVRHEWRLDGDLALGLDAQLRYFGGSRIGAGPALDSVQGDYLDTGVGLRLGSRRRAVTLRLDNLFDSRANRFALGTPYRIHDAQVTPQPPRRLRIGFEAAF